MAAQRKNQRRRRPISNLSPTAWRIINLLRRHDIYIVVPADKNLGPAILERDKYIRRCISEHLGNEKNYKVLTTQQVETRMRGLKYQLQKFLDKFWSDPDSKHLNRSALGSNNDEDEVTYITNAEHDFLSRALDKYPDKIAFFRGTTKVHKAKWKMRPIVCCAGTWINEWSRWLDYQLQKLKIFVPTYTKDSQQLIDETRDMVVPPGSLLCVADAVSMYNNIDTDHAIHVITWWLDELETNNQLPNNFPIEAVKYAMGIIMRNNIFQFGDLHFLQLLGTAMGTSAAVMWATLYFGYHEVHTLIPKYNNNLFYFRRFIDDIFLIWKRDSSDNWDQFQQDANKFEHNINGKQHGQLEWEFEKLSTSVNFLDLTLTIHNGRIITRTYQKDMNLYLYLPPASAHPRGCIKGTIYGLINRYYAQNTHRQDYIELIVKLYQRLLARGWTKEYIAPLIIEASEKIEQRSKHPQPTTTSGTIDDDDTRLFIHLQYHPDDVSRRELRQIYKDTCGNVFFSELGIVNPTIAYSRPPNIGEKITQAKLHQAPGKPSSYYLGEYNRSRSSSR